MKKRLRTMAMYLPQYHRVPENDKWWGEGFTEWTTVKAAERLYDGHFQPRVPMDNNYYDLLEKSTMEWQVKLALEYGIDAFCFYHYYFKDGKKILEKPIENLIKWKDIKISYCFCWANQTWARTWSNLWGANSWSEKFESNDDRDPILLEQCYGGFEQWKNHLDYLLPFFLDERYIKIKNKPVFLIYVPGDIVDLDDMIEYWNAAVTEYGFDGVYVIGLNDTKKRQGVSARLFQGPTAYRSPAIAGKTVKEIWKEGVKVFDYRECWENAIALNASDSIKTYYGGFVDYDDTPRRGKLGTSAVNFSVEIFREKLYELAIKNIVLGNEWLFINAWNEWGEGNYLEPDERNGYQVLKSVQYVMSKCNDDRINIQEEWNEICSQKSINSDMAALVKEVNKFREFYKVLNDWLTIKEHSLHLETYFTDHDYQRVLVYGMAELGKHLYEELYRSSLEVVGALDRRQGMSYKDLKFYDLDGKIPMCDIIVVTAISDYDIIKEALSKKTTCPIISLKDIINYISR